MEWCQQGAYDSCDMFFFSLDISFSIQNDLYMVDLS